jgi:hypothetical protein
MPDKTRLYFIKWNVKDWLTDTARLPLAVQGLWARILCQMLLEPTRGVYERTIVEAARELGCTKEELHTYLADLSKFKSVTFRNDIVTLKSARMIRDESERINHANRQARYRSKRESDATVTHECQKSDRHMLDVRSYKEKEKERESERVTPTANPKGLPASALQHPNIQKVQQVFKRPPPEPDWEAGAKFFGDLKTKFPRGAK